MEIKRIVVLLTMLMFVSKLEKNVYDAFPTFLNHLYIALYILVIMEIRPILYHYFEI
jgi:hypothetical protein